MSFPERHELPDGTPVYTGAGCPFDENGVDLALVDPMLTMTPEERLGWLEDMLALADTLRSGLEKPCCVMQRDGVLQYAVAEVGADGPRGQVA